MLAAARSLCGNNAGIVCILGTGSNSCYYNGNEIVKNVSPLGFILGDEGSGAYMGKLLVSDILKNQMPQHVINEFLEKYKLSSAEIIDKVYRKPFPNRFLAGFTPFIVEKVNDPCIYNLVYSSFKAFIQRNVMQYEYKHYKVNFIGSIAFHFKDILLKVAKEMGITVGIIAKSPIDGLVDYHK
jgi:Predicted N-acetylglucosamine kinase